MISDFLAGTLKNNGFFVLFGMSDQVEAKVDHDVFLLITDQYLAFEFIQFEGDRRPVAQFHDGEVYLASCLNVPDFILLKIL